LHVGDTTVAIAITDIIVAPDTAGTGIAHTGRVVPIATAGT